jgi:hypothetical protein
MGLLNDAALTDFKELRLLLPSPPTNQSREMSPLSSPNVTKLRSFMMMMIAEFFFDLKNRHEYMELFLVTILFGNRRNEGFWRALDFPSVLFFAKKTEILEFWLGRF